MKLRKLLVEFREDSLKHDGAKEELIKLRNHEVKYDGSYMNDVEQLQHVLDYKQQLIDNEKKTNELIDKIEKNRKEIINLFIVIELPPDKKVRVNLYGDSYADFWYEPDRNLVFSDSYTI